MKRTSIVGFLLTCFLSFVRVVLILCESETSSRKNKFNFQQCKSLVQFNCIDPEKNYNSNW